MSRRQEFLERLQAMQAQFPQAPERSWNLPKPRVPTLAAQRPPVPVMATVSRPGGTTIETAIPSDAQLQNAATWADKIRNFRARFAEGLRELSDADVARMIFGGGETQPAQPPTEATIRAPGLGERIADIGMQYEPVRRARSVLDPALDVAAGALSPENISPGGAVMHAAAPLVRTAEEAAEIGEAAVKGARAARTAEEVKGAARFPQYAEEYPPIPRPERKVDPKTGQSYLGKGTSKKTEEFMKERAAVSKEMEKKGYKPYFDPAERYHADPRNYPQPPEYAMPKKPETVAKWRNTIKTPEARQRLRQAFQAGVKAGGHEGWYKMGQLEKAFVDELGPEAGRAKFREWTESMAATTGGADPQSNLLMAQYGRFLKERGLPVPGASYKMPVPIGGRYVTGNMDMFNRLVAQGEGVGAGMPKRMSFSSDFRGFTDIPTIDEVMTGVITPGKTSPEGESYFAYAELVREEAAKANVPVDEYQAIVWGGSKSARGYTGKPMISIVNDAIERTARITGRSPEEVMRRGIVRGEIPIYGLVGAAGLGAAAAGAAGGAGTNQQ